MSCSSHHSRNARSAAFASKSCQRSIAFLRASKSLNFAYAPPLAEDVSNLVEVVRQAFARKVEHKWLAETKIALVGNRDVLLVVFNVVGEFVFLLAGKFNVHVNLTSRLAQNGLVLAEDALKGGKL